MSRTIKAIKLLHLLKETTSNNDEYIKVAKLMNEIRVVYSEYPDSPKGLDAWKAKLVPIYEGAKAA